METFMCFRRFMGRQWLVRDDFGPNFFASFRWNSIFTFSGDFGGPSFDSSIRSFNHLHAFSQHVWPMSRCGMSKGALAATQATRLWPRRCAGLAQGTHDSHDAQSPVFDLPACDHWDVCYVMLCASSRYCGSAVSKGHTIFVETEERT